MPTDERKEQPTPPEPGAADALTLHAESVSDLEAPADHAGGVRGASGKFCAINGGGGIAGAAGA
jgi:hypothetical protein